MDRVAAASSAASTSRTGQMPSVFLNGNAQRCREEFGPSGSNPQCAIGYVFVKPVMLFSFTIRTEKYVAWI
jgi:hypothetical protein